MEHLFNFMGDHVFLGFLIICSTYYLLKALLFRLPNRIIRHLNIRKAGWPPEYLDADGDFKEKEEVKQNEP